MKKKIFGCIVLLVIALVMAIIGPWDKFGSLKERILGGDEDISSLKVYSLGGSMTVNIDGEEKGVVNQEDTYLEILPITIGEHEVEIMREETEDGFYQDFKRTIYFEKGFDTVISYELGPTEESSSGWVLYAKDTGADESDITLHVNSIPNDCTMNLDGEDIVDTSTIKITTDKQYDFVFASEGYQSLKFQILPEDEESRKKLKGFELYLDVNLYQFPISQ